MIDKSSNLIERPPVVCIMGHIDHGKSTLLDYIRKTDICATEAGGITQRISAYEVLHPLADGTTKKITFLDTPGHEAFGKLRSRGVKAADIAILVVSAEDGVKPQTIEAFKCIKDNKLPYIVAINKIDRPGANVERTKQSLAENEIYVEGYGGTVPWVPISAKTGQGVSELLDTLLLLSEVEGFTADPIKPAEGVVIETHMDKQKGATARILIQDGTLKMGMFAVSGTCIAPIRILENFKKEKITEATFSSPVRVIGWNELPQVGDPFKTFLTKKEAENCLAENIENIKSNPELQEPNNDITDNEQTVTIPLIVKADVICVLEGIEHELKKIKVENIKIRLIHSGVGEINERDVKHALNKEGTLLVAFNVPIAPRAQSLAENSGVTIHPFEIIYKLTEWLEIIAEERRPRMSVLETSGRAKILKYFSATKDKHVIGGRLETGVISVGNTVKIIRRENEIGTGIIRELQQQKAKIGSVSEGEFGCMLESKIEPAPGDYLEAFTMVTK
ncbi:MAG: translation initiation factor IF-2 [Candidatus Paceibacterota bacterium]|jgi:translation initiation factor IF-2